MWSYLKPRDLIDFQRRTLIEQMGEQARLLLAEGYPADADRLLDELNARRRSWSTESA